MTFEEQFPSLRGLQLVGDAFQQHVIRNHCLDKNKVREALQQLNLVYMTGNMPTLDDVCTTIKNFQELGL